MPEETLAYYPVIKVDGANMPVSAMDMLLDLEVNTTLGVPSMFILRFSDDKDLSLSNGSDFDIGKEVEIEMPDDGTSVAVMKGEITAIEPDFTEGMITILTIRGYDKSHRLNRETITKSFIDMKDSDIVGELAGNAGLSADTEDTSTVRTIVHQDNQTDLAFLHMLAYRNGFEAFVDSSTLYFRKPQGDLGDIDLEWGNNLLSFRPRVSGAKQVNEVTVKSWDPKTKTAIVGQVTSPTSTDSQGGISDAGGSAAETAFGAAKHMEVHHNVKDQDEAQKIAQGIMNRISASFVQAEGVALGKPTIVAGKKVNLASLGDKYNGNYLVTSSTHVYSQEGYKTYFTVEGGSYPLMADLIGEQRATKWGGVFPAVVTNNNSADDDWGNVKVKFPWMPEGSSGELESGWARISTIGAGPERGIYWMPEIDDEVLVAFEHGDFNRPYIIGSLWNGTDAPPTPIGEAVANSKTEVRILKTRAGNLIRLTDTDGSEMIEIIDAKEKTSLTINAASGSEEFNVTTAGKVILEATGDIELTATGDLTLKGANVNIESTSGDVTIKSAVNATVEGTANATLKAGANAEVKATAQAKVSGTAGVGIESPAITEVKGSLVKIN
jgi:uncharacterized protein involved in type VI secretion and phage assembly